MLQPIVWKSQLLFDQRGSFEKVLDANLSEIKKFTVRDIFITKSVPRVIRGMHLQVGNYSNNRIINVCSGEVLDILVDLRPDSKQYLQVTSFTLGSQAENNTIFVPAGIAHGFLTIHEAKVLYLSDKQHHAAFDKGFNPLTFGHDWQIIDPIMSDRDKALPSLEEFLS